jgi:hypothetical protein
LKKKAKKIKLALRKINIDIKTIICYIINN